MGDNQKRMTETKELLLDMTTTKHDVDRRCYIRDIYRLEISQKDAIMRVLAANQSPFANTLNQDTSHAALERIGRYYLWI